MNTWSFMPRCPKCNASPDMPCAADPSRDPATCPTFEIHAAAIGYHVIADEVLDESGLPSPFDCRTPAAWRRISGP